MAATFALNDFELPVNIHTVHFCGTVSWTCRHCGSPNRRQVRSITWKVRCTNRLCKRWTEFIVIQQDIPKINRYRPYLRRTLDFLEQPSDASSQSFADPLDIDE